MFAFVRLAGDTTNSYFHVRMPSALNPLTFDFTASYAIFGNSYTITFDGADAVDVNRAAITGNVTEFYIPFGDITGDTGTANFQLESNISSPTLTRGTGTPNLTPELDSGPTGNWERVGGLGILAPERYHFSAGSIKDWQEVEGEDIFGKVVDVFSYRTTPSNLTIASNGDVTTTGLPEAVVTALTSNPIGRVASRTEDASLFFVSEVVSSTATSLVVRPQYLKTDTTEFVGADARAAIAGVTVGTSNSMFASLEKITEAHAGGLVIDIADTFNITRNDTDPGTPSQYAEITIDTDANSETLLQLVGAHPNATSVTTNADHAFTITAAGGTATPFTFPAGTTFVDVGDGEISVRFISGNVRNTFARDAEDTTDNGLIGSPQDNGNTTMAIELGTRVQKMRAGDNVNITATGDEATINSSVPFGNTATDVAPWAAGNVPPPVSGLPVDITDATFGNVTASLFNRSRQDFVVDFGSQTLRNNFLTATLGNTTGGRPTYPIEIRLGTNTATTVAGHTVIAPDVNPANVNRLYIQLFGPVSNYDTFTTALNGAVSVMDGATITGALSVGHQGIARSMSPPNGTTLSSSGLLDFPEPTIEQVNLTTTTPATITPGDLVVTNNAVRSQHRIANPDSNPNIGTEAFERSPVTGGTAPTLTNTEGIYEAHFDPTTPADTPRVVETELYFFRTQFNFTVNRTYAAFLNSLASFQVDTGGAHILITNGGPSLPLPVGAAQREVFIELSGEDGSGRTQRFAFRAGAVKRYRTNDLAISAADVIDPDINEPFDSLDVFSGRVYATNTEVLESDPIIEFSVLGADINRNATAGLDPGPIYTGQDRSTWGWLYEAMNLSPGTTLAQINEVFSNFALFELYGSETSRFIYHYNGTVNLENQLSPLTTPGELNTIQTRAMNPIPTAELVNINENFEQLSLQEAVELHKRRSCTWTSSYRSSVQPFE